MPTESPHFFWRDRKTPRERTLNMNAGVGFSLRLYWVVLAVWLGESSPSQFARVTKVEGGGWILHCGRLAVRIAAW